MTDIEFHHGKLPPDPSKPRLSFSQFVTVEREAPPSADWGSAVPSWPMYLNDRYGDCVFADIGHAIEVFTQYGYGNLVKVGDADIIKGYSDVTGFNPNDPSTDNGTIMQEAMSYWRKVGIGGHKILAFADVNIDDLNECKYAASMFLGLNVGIKFPRSAMGQFNRGEPWDVVEGSPIEGGHAILGVWYDTAIGMWKFVTWGRLQTMTENFFRRYVDEAWVVLSEDMFDPDSKLDPKGVDRFALGEQFSQLTGEDNPFPAPPPSPPVDDTIDRFLEIALLEILDNKNCPEYLKRAAAPWLRRRGSL